MVKDRLTLVLFYKQLVHAYNRQQGGLYTVYHILHMMIDVYYILKQTELKYEAHYSTMLILYLK